MSHGDVELQIDALVTGIDSGNANHEVDNKDSKDRKLKKPSAAAGTKIKAEISFMT